MNLLTGRVCADGTHVEVGGAVLALASRSDVAGDVVVGVRPEHVDVSNGGFRVEIGAVDHMVTNASSERSPRTSLRNHQYDNEGIVSSTSCPPTRRPRPDSIDSWAVTREHCGPSARCDLRAGGTRHRPPSTSSALTVTSG